MSPRYSPDTPAGEVVGRYRLAAAYVWDHRHFLDLPATYLSPARRMAEHLTSVVRTATAGRLGLAVSERAALSASTSRVTVATRWRQDGNQRLGTADAARTTLF